MPRIVEKTLKMARYNVVKKTKTPSGPISVGDVSVRIRMRAARLMTPNIFTTKLVDITSL